MDKILIWTPAEMAEIIQGAQEIRTDPSLLVRNDGIAPRPIGCGERVTMDQEAMIRSGLIWC